MNISQQKLQDCSNYILYYFFDKRRHMLKIKKAPRKGYLILWDKLQDETFLSNILVGVMDYKNKIKVFGIT